MKNKQKTHKGLKKRLKKTGKKKKNGNPKFLKYTAKRKQRFSRRTENNTDIHDRALSNVDRKKAKKLLNQ